MENTITTELQKSTLSLHGNTKVVENINNKQKALLTLITIKSGEIISKFKAGITQSNATYLTVQIGIDTHITLQPEHLQYINHSCNPNVFFKTTTMELIALKDIQSNEELTFFYPSTEWEMVQPFVCNCGSNNCLKIINGAANLSQADIGKYGFTNFIQSQFQLKELA